MIYDTLEKAYSYPLGPTFEKAVAFIRNLGTDAALGRHEIDGDALYANVMEYETAEGVPEKYETHRKYADLQALISGSEALFVRSAAGLSVHTAYNPVKDCEFLASDGIASDVKLQLVPGNFALLFPQDAHMGKGISYQGKAKLKKVVVKIALDSLVS